MSLVKNFVLSACALALFAQPVLAASTCANDTDLAAFRTAAVEQQLMVAALTCKDVEAYNRFVLSYQPELQKSDADLKAYFIRRGNEAEYDTFKTKLANLSSLSDIANGPAYCDNAAAAFDMALKSRQSLASFVADQRLMIAMPQQTLCAAPKAEVQMAAIKSAPVELAAARRVPVKIAENRPAPVKLAMTMPPVALGAPTDAAPAEKIADVPAHDLPASPFGGEARPAPATYEHALDSGGADALPLPARPPHTREAQRLQAYYAAQYAQGGNDANYYQGR
jgi:hypothetical protein